MSVLELGQYEVGLWGSQNSVNHKEGSKIGLFVKNEAKDLCKDKIWSFFVFLALSSVICRPTSCGLKVLIKKGLIKKFI